MVSSLENAESRWLEGQGTYNDLRDILSEAFPDTRSLFRAVLASENFRSLLEYARWLMHVFADARRITEIPTAVLDGKSRLFFAEVLCRLSELQHRSRCVQNLGPGAIRVPEESSSNGTNLNFDAPWLEELSHLLELPPDMQQMKIWSSSKSVTRSPRGSDKAPGTPLPEPSLVIHSSTMVGAGWSGGALMHAKCEKEPILLWSAFGPVDAVIAPRARRIIIRSELSEARSPQITRMFQAALENPELFTAKVTGSQNGTSNSLAVAILLRSNRPFHVFSEELFGFWQSIQGDFQPQMLLTGGSSFFCPQSLGISKSATMEKAGIQDWGLSGVFFCRWERLNDNVELADGYVEWLKKSAPSKHLTEMHLPSPKPETWVWLGITSGEKRYWLEEFEGLLAVIDWANGRFQECAFLFDGWTSPQKKGSQDKKMIELHNDTLGRVLEARPDVRWKSIIGAQLEEKISEGSCCKMFVSEVGTPTLIPSKLLGKPGVAYGNPWNMRNRIFVLGQGKVFRVAEEEVKPSRPNVAFRDGILGSYDSYSISPIRVVELCEELLESGAIK